MRAVWITGLATTVAAAFFSSSVSAQILPPTVLSPPIVLLDVSQFEALKQRAETGDARAESVLGDVYGGARAARTADGHTVPLDYATAKLWYTKAADQGYAEAEYNLGMIYLYYDSPIDPAQGLMWLRKSADQGFNTAQYYLAELYYDGQVVQKDDVEAYKWFALSAVTARKWQFNNPPAGIVANLETEMTADQVTRAKAMVAAWKPAA